jgi:glycosyltransferase involved in cell wall biosynthesis
MSDIPGKPLISVIIPCYNSATYLESAVRTVLEQTYGCHEIIVIDDGSTDSTSELLRKFDGELQYLYQANRGPSAARNTGIKAAKGKYICFLDADDTWNPEKLELQLRFMETNPDVGLVFSDEEEADSEKILSPSLLTKSQFYPEIVSQPRLKEAATKLLIENFVPTSTVMTRRECFEYAGFFDEGLPVSEDRDMWSRIAARFPIACLPFNLGRKRAHQQSISSNVEVTLRSRIRVWEKARRDMPRNAPGPIIDGLLADARLYLGYILLRQDRRKEARQEAVRSISCAIKHVIARSSTKGFIPRYQWHLSLVLIPLTFISKRT